ncbi:hypothetical protein K1719_005844 [Acacia pycnantha]|nr:hypothetical protein K1719_005844 [Acacia pycnantha]
MVSPNAVEVAKAVQEVADVAWTVVECSHHLRHHNDSHSSSDENDENLKSLRSKNRRLRSLLEKNLLLLHNLSQSPSLLNDCPLEIICHKKNYGKCPQCNRKCALRDVMKLYAACIYYCLPFNIVGISLSDAITKLSDSILIHDMQGDHCLLEKLSAILIKVMSSDSFWRSPLSFDRHNDVKKLNFNLTVYKFNKKLDFW